LSGRNFEGLVGVSKTRKLSLEIGQSAIELFAVTRILGRLQIVLHASAREHQQLPPPL